MRANTECLLRGSFLYLDADSYLPYPTSGDLHEPVEGEGVEHDEDGEGDEEVDQAVQVVQVAL